jgi:hypothetical protein
MNAWPDLSMRRTLSTTVGLGLDMTSSAGGSGGGSRKSGAGSEEEAMARSRICRFLRDTSQVDIRWKKPSGVASGFCSILLRSKKAVSGDRAAFRVVSRLFLSFTAPYSRSPLPFGALALAFPFIPLIWLSILPTVDSWEGGLVL